MPGRVVTPRGLVAAIWMTSAAGALTSGCTGAVDTEPRSLSAVAPAHDGGNGTGMGAPSGGASVFAASGPDGGGGICLPVGSFNELQTCPRTEQGPPPAVHNCGQDPTSFCDNQIDTRTHFGKADFTACCNARDVCYGSCGSDKTKCDLSFKDCMNGSCARAFPEGNSVKPCETAALAAFKRVHDAGDCVFQSDQVKGCLCCNCSNKPPCGTGASIDPFTGLCACTVPGQATCCGTCVDLGTDPNNCGACGKHCGGGQACQSGVCNCPADSPVLCNGRCTDISGDPLNCGACGSLCPALFLCCADNGVPPQCFDPLTDNQNCGTCGKECKGGQTCQAGTCRCPAGQLFCETIGKCVDTSSDSENCGKCGQTCGAGQSCVGGQCVCPSGQTLCDGACVDTTTDKNHCGGCSPCPAPQACLMGTCACAPVTCPMGAFQDPTTCQCACLPGQTLCDQGTCVDLQSDPDNCGSCGTGCPSGKSCQSGQCLCTHTTCPPGTSQDPATCQCLCPPGQTSCPTGCVDLQSDDANCGACGTVCPSGQSCQSGQCLCTPVTCPSGATQDPITCQCPCPNGQSDCNGACVDLQNDANNCGSCGHQCQTCKAGQCFCPPMTCPLNATVDPTTCQCVCPQGQFICGGNTGTCCDRLCCQVSSNPPLFVCTAPTCP